MYPSYTWSTLHALNPDPIKCMTKIVIVSIDESNQQQINSYQNPSITFHLKISSNMVKIWLNEFKKLWFSKSKPIFSFFLYYQNFI